MSMHSEGSGGNPCWWVEFMLSIEIRVCDYMTQPKPNPFLLFVLKLTQNMLIINPDLLILEGGLNLLLSTLSRVSQQVIFALPPSPPSKKKLNKCKSLDGADVSTPDKGWRGALVKWSGYNPPSLFRVGFTGYVVFHVGGSDSCMKHSFETILDQTV